MAEQESKDYIEPAPLDRMGLAIALRQAGVDVDFEDWDGMCDDDVRKRVQFCNLGFGARPDGRVAYHPEEQGDVVAGLIVGDRAMFEREYVPDLFSTIIGGEYEV